VDWVSFTTRLKPIRSLTRNLGRVPRRKISDLDTVARPTEMQAISCRGADGAADVFVAMEVA